MQWEAGKYEEVSWVTSQRPAGETIGALDYPSGWEVGVWRGGSFPNSGGSETGKLLEASKI